MVGIKEEIKKKKMHQNSSKKDTYYLVKLKKWEPVFRLRGRLFDEYDKKELISRLDLEKECAVRKIDERIYGLGLSVIFNILKNKEVNEMKSERDISKELKEKGFDALAAFMDDAPPENVVEKKETKDYNYDQIIVDEPKPETIRKIKKGEIFNNYVGKRTEYIEGEGRVPIESGASIIDTGNKASGTGSDLKTALADIKRTCERAGVEYDEQKYMKELKKVGTPEYFKWLDGQPGK